MTTDNKQALMTLPWAEWLARRYGADFTEKMLGEISEAVLSKLRGAGEPSDLVNGHMEKIEEYFYAVRRGLTGKDLAKIYDDIESSAHALLSRYDAPQASANKERIRQLEAECSALHAARFAYASEFPSNAEGDPDVDNIHANIRALKVQVRNAALEEAAALLDDKWATRLVERAANEIRKLKSAPATMASAEPAQMALLRGRAQDEEPRVRHSCNMGVGCEESGVCYAAAHGEPSRCGIPDTQGEDLPPLPEPVDSLALADGFNVIGVQDVFTAEQMRAYALADRQQRDDDLTIAYLCGAQAEKERQPRGGGGVIAECWKVLHEAGLDRRRFDGPLPDAIRAALFAQESK